jgi:hypothetical protein
MTSFKARFSGSALAALLLLSSYSPVLAQSKDVKAEEIRCGSCVKNRKKTKSAPEATPQVAKSAPAAIEAISVVQDMLDTEEPLVHVDDAALKLFSALSKTAGKNSAVKRCWDRLSAGHRTITYSDWMAAAKAEKSLAPLIQDLQQHDVVLSIEDVATMPSKTSSANRKLYAKGDISVSEAKEFDSMMTRADVSCNANYVDRNLILRLNVIVNGPIYARNVVAVTPCNSLLVNRVCPVQTVDVPVGMCTYTEDTDGTTCFCGNVGIEPGKELRTNTITACQLISDIYCEGQDLCEADSSGTVSFTSNVTFEGNVSSNASACFETAATNPTTGQLLTNFIHPVQLDIYDNCVADDSGITNFSADVAIVGSGKKLLVNEINPGFIDIYGNPQEDDSAHTCFSGDVGLFADKELWVNEVSPVQMEYGECVPNTVCGAATHFNGDVSIKNKRIFGQIDNVTFGPSVFSPVIGVHFINTGNDQSGAYVKVHFVGTWERITYPSISTFFDVFYEGEFFVAPGDIGDSGLIDTIDNNSEGIEHQYTKFGHQTGLGEISGNTCYAFSNETNINLKGIPSMDTVGAITGTLFYEVIGTNVDYVVCEPNGCD